MKNESRETRSENLESFLHEAEALADLISHATEQVDFDKFYFSELVGQIDQLYQVGVAYDKYAQFCKRANQHKPAKHLSDLEYPSLNMSQINDLHSKVVRWRDMDRVQRRDSGISGDQLRAELTQYFQNIRRIAKSITSGYQEGPSSIERWIELDDIYKSFNISLEDCDAMMKENEDSAEVVGRSFATMQSMMDKFTRSGFGANEFSTEDLKEQLDKEQGQKLRFSYYEKTEDALEILRSESIMILEEHDKHERRKRAKSMDTAESIIDKRKEIENALGHGSGRVVHTTVDSKLDESFKGGAMENYGPICFEMGVDKVKQPVTFTIGDSLNAGAVHNLFATGFESLGSEYHRARTSAQNRQVIFEHLPLAKAIMHLSAEEEIDPIYYIEAQISDPGSEIFNATEGIAINGELDDLQFAQLLELAKEKGVPARSWG